MSEFCDILVFAVGYESRASHILSNTKFSRAIGIELDDRGLSCLRNREKARKAGAELVDPSNFKSAIDRELGALLKSGASLDLVIDISSMPRLLIADLLLYIERKLAELDIKVTAQYSVGEYRAPISSPPEQFEFAPLPDWEGWTVHPERPSSLVAGVGYERNLVLGAREEIDPSGVWLYIPIGKDERFYTDVLSANSELLDFVPDERVIEYSLSHPARLYRDLVSLCESLVSTSRVTIVTAGPKMFSLVALLVARKVGTEVGIWRASWHSQTDPVDVEAEGEIIKLDLSSFIDGMRSGHRRTGKGGA